MRSAVGALDKVVLKFRREGADLIVTDMAALKALVTPPEGF